MGDYSVTADIISNLLYVYQTKQSLIITSSNKKKTYSQVMTKAPIPFKSPKLIIYEPV